MKNVETWFLRGECFEVARNRCKVEATLRECEKAKINTHKIHLSDYSNNFLILSWKCNDLFQYIIRSSDWITRK